jgi:hypothetical protein
MLLAVMDLLEEATLKDNRIELNKALVQKFRNHFEMMRTGADQANAHLPFYHLKSDGFWHHQIRPGKEGDYEELRNAIGPARMRDAIAYAYLDDELFEYLKYSVTREQFKHALFENIDSDARADLRGAIGDWSQLECELIARDYLDMLVKELGGIAYSKAEHRRALQPHLQNRSEGAIEYKYQNISAVLIDLGLPYIRGYKPAFNYQALLASVVTHHVTARRLQIERGAEDLIQAPPEPGAVDWATVLDEPPELEHAGRPTPSQRTPAPAIQLWRARESEQTPWRIW